MMFLFPMSYFPPLVLLLTQNRPHSSERGLHALSSYCTSQQIMDTKAKIIKHKKIDYRAPVVGA